MKKYLSVILSTILLVTTLTACGGSNDVTDSPGSDDSSDKPDEVIEIRFTEWDGGATLQVYENIINEFNNSQDKIRVTVMNIPDEYETKITAMVVGKDTPEIGMMESAGLLFPYAEEGVVLNLNDFIEKDDTFDSSILMEQFKYNLTEEYMAGYGMGSEDIIMFYNPILFQENDVEEPPAEWDKAWDWNTFVSNAKTLTIDKNGRNAHDSAFDPENIDVYGVSFGKWWAVYLPFVLSNGGAYLNESGTATGLTSPAALDALQKLQDLIYVHHVAPTPTQSQNMPGLSEAIATNKIAMQFEGQWVNEALMSDGVEYNVAALPRMGEKASTISTFSAISILDTDKKDAAWELFKHFLNEGVLLPLYESGLWLPATTLEYTPDFINGFISENHPENYYDAVVVPLLDGLADSPPTKYVRNFNKINDALTPAFDLIWSGELSVKDALGNVEESVNAEVNGFYGR